MPDNPTSADRAVLHLGGEEVSHFLDRLITTRVPDAERPVRFSALLTPQGKILFDFFLYLAEDGFWLDCPSLVADDLIKRLTFYKLRADVTITDRRSDLTVLLIDKEPSDALVFAADPRHPDLPSRAIYPQSSALIELMRGDATRIRLGFPEGGQDYQYGDVFPHDAGFDLVGAVDLDKGCFVGQEVVSRMAHRGTSRKRPVCLESQGEALSANMDIWAENRVLGTITSATGRLGLSILRLDRAASAVAEGTTLVAGDEPIQLSRPVWADYDWPEALQLSGNGAQQ